MFSAADRQDLVAKEQAQLDILSEYLPKPLTNEEAEVIINKIILWKSIDVLTKFILIAFK